MGYHLELIAIVAIACASLAVLVLLAGAIAHIRRRSLRKSTTRRKFDAPDASYTTFGYPHPSNAPPATSSPSGSASASKPTPARSNPYLAHPSPITPPPSTGTSNASTLLGTPVSKLRKGERERDRDRNRGRSPRSPQSPEQARVAGGIPIRSGGDAGGGGTRERERARMRDRPETKDMVMVTYEEGLQRLGIANAGRPHHILYPEDGNEEEYGPGPGVGPYPDPPAFDAISIRSPRPSPRKSPGRAGLGAGGRTGAGGGGGGWRAEQGMAGREGMAVEAPPTPRRSVPGVQSSWLPSYYHTARREVDEESELGYRSRWAGNRI